MMELIVAYTYGINADNCSKCGGRPYGQTVVDGETNTEMYRVVCDCGNHTAKKFTQKKAIRFWNIQENNRK